MKIDLTRKEYRDLLDMLYIAEWVLNAHRMEEDSRTKRYGELEQKFLALAEKMKYENLIEYAPEAKKYFPTQEYEETSSVHPFIDEYEDDTFWKELTSHLSARDLARKLGGYDKINDLSFQERFRRLGELEEFYSDEFVLNGLENLQLRRKTGLSQTGRIIH